MPFNWDAESERAMLMIACADLKPSTATWQTVADRLGGGLNANAVSQKFYKLKKESEKLINGNNSNDTSTPTTPTPLKKTPKTPGGTTTTARKRKTKLFDDNEETPTKRTKKRVAATTAAASELDDSDIKSEAPDAMNEQSNDDVEALNLIISSSREPIDLDMEEDEGRKAEEA